jgi:hypothetical protein
MQAAIMPPKPHVSYDWGSLAVCARGAALAAGMQLKRHAEHGVGAASQPTHLARVTRRSTTRAARPMQHYCLEQLRGLWPSLPETNASKSAGCLRIASMHQAVVTGVHTERCCNILLLRMSRGHVVP